MVVTRSRLCDRFRKHLRDVTEWLVVHRGKCADNVNYSFVSRRSNWMLIATFRLLTASHLRRVRAIKNDYKLCEMRHSNLHVVVN